MDLQQMKADITIGLSQEQLQQQVTCEHTRKISLEMTKWEDWASALELTPVQMEDIDRENRTMHTKRLAVLRVWEESFGSTATYDKLINALLKFRMRKMAELVCSLLKMPSVAISSPEYDTFLLHYDEVVDTIQDPLPLATRLFATGVIDRTVLESVTMPALPVFKNTHILLSAVKGRLQTDPSAFDAFLSALKQDPSLQSLVESMEGGHLSTAPGAHVEGGTSPRVRDQGRPPESRDGGEEQSLPPTKYRCVVSGLEASAHGESAVHVPQHYAHRQNHKQPTYQPLQHLNRPSIHPHNHPSCQIWNRLPYPPLVQLPHQPPHYPSLHPPPFYIPMGQPRYECTGSRQIQPPYYHPPHILCQSPPVRSPQSRTCIYQPPHQPPLLPPQPFHLPPQPFHLPPQPPHLPPRLPPRPPRLPSHLPPQPPHLPPQPPRLPPQPPRLPPQPPRQPPQPPCLPPQPPYLPPQPPHLPPQPPHLPPQPSCQYPQTPCHPPQPPHSSPYQPPGELIQPPHLPARHPSYHPSSQPTPHPDTPLGKYALFLRKCYTLHKAPSTKWPYLDAQSYVNLAVISSEYANREELKKFREQTIHGCVDDILNWKAPIAMKDILQPKLETINGQVVIVSHPVTQLLIEGAPGIGKSTLAWEVCQKWGQHELFTEYSLVVLLKFRDKRVQDAETVSDLFYYPLPELQSEIVRDIVLSSGQGLLLILEGFDEAPASKRTMDTVFVRLFTGQELPKATVVMTSRPSASAELRQLCRGIHSRRIEVVGFGKKEINEYVQCAFSDKQLQSDFTEYLSLYPHIHAIMYVPLNSAIVVEVFKSCSSSSLVVPKTMTQVYSSLIRSLLLRYLKESNGTCTSINSFKDLPQPVYNQFHDICKLAYTGIMSAETELIFRDLPRDFDPLGLMQTCPELYVDSGASVSYNFLHFTIQEYLAAYYISRQSRVEQLAFMKEHIENKKLEVVVRFLAGFSLSELGQDLWDVVRGFASEPQLSMGATESVKLQILHWLFESQCLSAITSILGSDSVCFYRDCTYSLPFDLYVLGYCITHSSCDWKLKLLCIELESVEAFLNALKLLKDQFLLPSKGQIKRMVLLWSDPAALHLLVANMPQKLVFHNLTHLSLCSSDLTSEICNHLCEHAELLKHLLLLNLYGNPIGRGGVVNLITSLTKISTIKQLHLTDTGVGFEDCKALSELLASSKYIEVLYIGSNNLAPDSIQLIVDGLSHNISLEKIDMRHSDFSSENVVSLASVLRVNTRLKVLDIGHCNIQSSDSVYLAKALEANTTTLLQTLFLNSNPIGSTGAVAFARMLATDRSLGKLHIENCSIGGDGAVHLAEALENNSTVKGLFLSKNAVGTVGAVALAGMLATNRSLAKLRLENCGIGEEGAVRLAEALENNTTVMCLILSKNAIGSAGAIALADMLATNESLTELHMNFCNIEDGALAFSSMLKRNPCLRKLELHDDSVGVEDALNIIESLHQNSTLEKLKLSRKCKPPSFSTLDTAMQERVKFTIICT